LFNRYYTSGADPGFQVRGAHLKKLRRVEEGAKYFGVFRVKNHDFTPKNYIVSNCGGRRENFWGMLTHWIITKRIFQQHFVPHLIL
jgi:hypothetical protein